MAIRPFEARDIDDVMRLAAAEGWPSLSSDKDRALRALMVPGVIAVVAAVEDRVAGYAHALTDGVTTTYLSTIAVEAGYRGQHVGQQLIEAIFQCSGVGRIDLPSEDEAEGFYQHLLHRRKPGYRLYSLGSGQ